MTDLANITEGYDRYIRELFATEDAVLQQTRAETAAAGMQDIAVSAPQGKLLHMLARMCNARRVLEIGALGGYSATWLARGLPEDGKLISLELDPHHADVARRNVARAGLADRVEIRVGPALESLRQLAAEGTAPFDLVFIDADKEGYVDYLQQSVPLLRPGGWLLADNTLPRTVLDAAAQSGAKRYNAAVAAHPDLTSIIVPQLRDRGIDGLTISVKS